MTDLSRFRLLATNFLAQGSDDHRAEVSPTVKMSSVALAGDGDDLAAPPQFANGALDAGHAAAMVLPGTVTAFHRMLQPQEHIVGTDGDDTLTGHDADDTIDGLGGSDTIDAGGGNDTLNGVAGNDVLTVTVDGSSTLDGGADDDTMNIGINAPHVALNGGTGNDTLSGGAGADRFVFRSGDGLDVVTDFTHGSDVIQLHGYDAANYAALAGLMSQVGSDVLIAFDMENHITLHGVQLAQLTAGDFAFV